MGSGCPPAPPHPGSCRFPHPPRQPPSPLAEEAPATSLHRRFWSHGVPGCNNGVALPRGCSPGPGDGAGLQHLGLPKTSSSQAKPGFRGAGGAEQGGAQGQAGWVGRRRVLSLSAPLGAPPRWDTGSQTLAPAPLPSAH